MRQYIFDINKFELAKLLRNHYKYTAVAVDPNILVTSLGYPALPGMIQNRY